MSELRHPLATARSVADLLVEVLRPACSRIEIAGSIRRRLSSVKDIEIVAAPHVQRDLFGAATLVDELRPVVDELVAAGRLAWRTNASTTLGRRFYPLLAVKSGIPVDLFAVLPPAQWGAIFAIRTGPHDFSRQLVTSCQHRALRCVDGRLVRENGETVETPEERDFLRQCGVEWLEPEMRR